MTGLAIPYGKPSTCFSTRLPYALEVIEQHCFRRSVETGLSARGRPVFACWGHNRAGRKNWRIASTADGSLRVWQDSIGVWFSLPGIALPADFSGVSIKLEPVRWRRETESRWRLLEGFIRHIAILREPETPAYLQTFDMTRLLSQE